MKNARGRKNVKSNCGYGSKNRAKCWPAAYVGLPFLLAVKIAVKSPLWNGWVGGQRTCALGCGRQNSIKMAIR